MDENQNDKQDIEIVPGQMCYDELLLPQEEDLKEEKDTSIAPGQFDIWSLPKAQKTEQNKQKTALKIDENTVQKSQENTLQIQLQTQDENLKIDEKTIKNSLKTQKNEEKPKKDVNFEDLPTNDIYNETNEKTEVKIAKPVFKTNKNQFVLKDENLFKYSEDVEVESFKQSQSLTQNIEEYMDEKFEEIKMNLNENIDENPDNVASNDENTQGQQVQSDKTEMSGNGGGNSYGGGYSGSNGILFKPLEEVLHDSMIPYTEHVVLDRALPRVEDGLKPVQRRILYSMLELGLTPDKPYRKSARIVGDCMGKYHPHGDSSVYDAMVRMSQDFVLRAPLVDGHGNFGSVDGDSAAAMRYTEARMTPLAMELLRDLEKDTVRWGLNFDDTLKEPDVLPGRFPNLLVNGASGIAVGVATNIPPHNLGEVIDGVVAYINNPNIKLAEMMKIIKGPDFPTGGELICGDGLQSAYETGKGKIILRAKVGIEQNGDKQSLVITEIPYQVNKAQLLQKIAELKDKNKDKLSCISEIRDESDRNGMRAVIRLKKEADPKKVLGILLQSTNLQVSYAINMVAIAGGKPKLLPLMEIISYYTAFQRDVVVRRTKFDLNVAKDRAHIVEGLLIAIKNIDAVIKIIKTSANVSEAKARLRDKFKLSEKQAQAILDMRLARLVNLEVTKLEEELAALKLKIKELEEILGSKKLQLEVVKKEILEIKHRFANPRRSHQAASTEIKLAKLEDIEDTNDYFVALSAGKTIKKFNVKNYNKSQKTISEGSTLFDIHTQLLPVKPNDTILIFTDRGNCLKMQVDKMPECKLRDKGFTLKNLDKSVDLMEVPVCMLKVEGDGELAFFTLNGMVKRSTEKDCVVSKSFYQVLKLNDGDRLLKVQHEIKGKSFVLISAHGYCVNFEKSEVPLQGRVSGGVKGINLEEKDTVVFAGQNIVEDFAIITDNGFAKRLQALSIPISGRNRKGVKCINFASGGKQIAFVGSGDKFVVDHGLKFAVLNLSKTKVTADRLNVGVQEIKSKFLGVYGYTE